MPELPEVETTRRGVAPHVKDRRIERVIVRDPRLRWPVAPELAEHAAHRAIRAVERRAKYLLFRLGDSGTLMLHLGMSGSVRVVPASTPPQRHDHVDIVLDDGRALRFTDPRRFGSLHWIEGDPDAHPLLRALGPEPLDDDFHGDYLYRISRGRRASVKALLMDSHVVVGVGNIYANEALYRAGIRPSRAAGRVGRERYRRLATAVKDVLTEAIIAGGTTLRDFTGTEGRPGYFRQQLSVYGRSGQPCHGCGETLRETRLGQRATVYCPHCQR